MIATECFTPFMFTSSATTPGFKFCLHIAREFPIFNIHCFYIFVLLTCGLFSYGLLNWTHLPNTLSYKLRFRNHSGLVQHYNKTSLLSYFIPSRYCTHSFFVVSHTNSFSVCVCACVRTHTHFWVSFWLLTTRLILAVFLATFQKWFTLPSSQGWERVTWPKVTQLGLCLRLE